MHANRNKLFVASCVALVTTSMLFSIRGDILDALGADFKLSKEQLGIILSPAFWGFTVSILVGGSLVDLFGMRRLLYLASFGYVGGVLAILFAPTPSGPVTSLTSDPGFIILYAAMLTLGLSQGLVEGVINPLCTTLYPDDKTHRMNLLHAWWPGGLIIGGLLAYTITKIMGLDGADVSAATASLGWRIKLSLILFSALLYALLIRGQQFPATERVTAGVSTNQMLREALRPMFLLFWICMWMTAATELGPDQWVGSVISNLTGMSGILILVYTAGIMFVLRFLRRADVSPFFSHGRADLLGDSLRYRPLRSQLRRDSACRHSPQPPSLASARRISGRSCSVSPRSASPTAALSCWRSWAAPAIWRWPSFCQSWAAGMTPKARRRRFRYVAVFPVVLTVIFAALFFYYKSIGGYRAVELSTDSE